MVEFLVDHGANIHAQNDRALLIATIYDQFDVIKYLLSQGANLSVLSLKKRQQYQYLVPRMISIHEYYQIESNVEMIKESPDRYIFSMKNGTNILLK